MDAESNARFTGSGVQMLAAAAVYCLFPASSRHPSKEGDTGQWLPLLPCSASCGRSRYSGTVGVKCLKKSFELEVISGTRTIFIFQSTLPLFFS